MRELPRIWTFWVPSRSGRPGIPPTSACRRRDPGQVRPGPEHWRRGLECAPGSAAAAAASPTAVAVIRAATGDLLAILAGFRLLQPASWITLTVLAVAAAIAGCAAFNRAARRPVAAFDRLAPPVLPLGHRNHRPPAAARRPGRQRQRRNRLPRLRPRPSQRFPQYEPAPQRHH